MNGITLIGLSGPKGSGKSTAASLLAVKMGFRVFSFAEPIRRAVLDLFPAWSAVDLGRPNKDRICPVHKISPREAMRAFGEHTRSLCPAAYTDAMERALADAYFGGDQHFVIDDVRMPHEADMIRAMGGHVVHLHGKGIRWSGEHATEQGPGEHATDLHLINRGTLRLLESDLIRLLVKPSCRATGA